MIYLLITALSIYFIYTLNFAIQFNKTTVFNKNQKLIHNFLIWIIPFFWIIVVKSMIAPTPGSDKLKKTKSKGRFYESGIGIWGLDDEHHHDSSHEHHGED